MKLQDMHWCKMVQPLFKNSLALPVYLMTDLTSLLVGIYPRKAVTHVQQETHSYNITVIAKKIK